MDNSKLNTQLTAALNANENELRNSPELNTGLDEASGLWTLIIRHTGSLSSIKSDFPQVRIKELLGNYAIIDTPENLIDAISFNSQIIYIEKPKRLFFQVSNGKRASCISPLQMQSASGLSGRGTLIAIIDSGIDYIHPDFISPNGKSRIISLWDQSLDQIFSSDTIDAAIAAPTLEARYSICPSVDLSGHGTHVAGIAAGNGRASNGVYRGVAYEAQLIIVKLASPAPGGFPSTVELMTAVDYCIREAISRSMPIAINLSFGNTYGAHNGSSLLENYLDDMTDYYKCSIVCGSGNEGASNGHTQGLFTSNMQADEVELAIAQYTKNLSIQLWKNPWDIFEIKIKSPSNSNVTLPVQPGSWRYSLDSTQLYITIGEPSPYSIYQEIYIDLNSSASIGSYIDEGIWQILITSIDIKKGNWDMWLPSSAVKSPSTGFLRPTPYTTLTIPSSAERVITVGAYDARNDRLAAFSGHGYNWDTDIIKPELVAPGVDITSCAPGGGYQTRSGTSMATPFVCGSCSLLMQWGIVDGNDDYLYGEKIKAALIRGTRKLPFINSYPNEAVGWGALCLSDSIPFFN